MVTVRIGTRGSALALAQADLVSAALKQHAQKLNIPVHLTIHPIKTTGDCMGDVSLKDHGGKSLFTREIDKALLDGQIDLAVHSMKDVETTLEPGIAIWGCLPRGDVRDVLVTADRLSLHKIKPGAVIGTCAPRRTAFIKAQRPDVTVRPLRGNVTTRLEVLRRGDSFDGIILAAAGLRRLGHVIDHVGVPFDPQVCVPAAGQGIIGVMGRMGDDLQDHPILAGLCDGVTKKALLAERLFLQGLGGDCTTPVGCYVWPDDAGDSSTFYRFKGIVYKDGDRPLTFDGAMPYDQLCTAIESDGRLAGQWFHGTPGDTAQGVGEGLDNVHADTL